MEKGMLRAAVRGAYDLQKLRIQTGLRLVANFKVKLGQAPSKKEEEIDDDAKHILAQLRDVYERITDGLTKFPRPKDFVADAIISEYSELVLIDQYVSLDDSEKKHFKKLVPLLESFRIYTEYLKDVKGIGPAMAGVIISEIDISKARYVSSLWKYAGLDVASDGAGRSRHKEHLVPVKYIDKNGEEQERVGITFNPFLKTKLLGVLASSFLRAGDNQYSAIYREYKHRLESHERYGTQNDKVKTPEGKQITSKGRRHNMAMRYCVKMFLKDLYVQWRTIEGLPVAPSYAEAKLGLRHRVA
jgi:hypothetical protein